MIDQESMLKLNIRSHYKVIGFNGPQTLIKRLKELGIQEGEALFLQTKIPFGGPYVVRFKNAHLALRKDELKCLQLQPIK